MKRLSSHRSCLIYLIALVTCASRSWAKPCDAITLPSEIKSILEKEFVGWRIVTPELLSSPEQRQLWKEEFSSECPGIISGHFRGQQVEYAINLIRGSDNTLEQQVVFFGVSTEGFAKTVLVPPSRATIVNVLRKGAPGMYRDPDTGRSVKVRFDTIALARTWAGAVAFYWDGKRFQRIDVSV